MIEEDVIMLIDTAVYGDMHISYFTVEDGYACRVHFENCDISNLIKGESIEEAYQKTVAYLERLRHKLDTWR